MNQTPLNILQVYYEPAPAGQTRHVSALTQALAPQHHVTVVLPDCLLPGRPGAGRPAPGREMAWSGVEQSGVRLVPLPMRKLLWPRPTLQALARLIRQEPWHIIHIHSLEAGLCGRLTIWWASRSRRRMGDIPRTQLVYTPQTIDIRRSGWHGLYRLLERYLAPLTSAIISVNEADRQRLMAWGISPDRVITIPNGIDLDAFQDPMSVRAAQKSLGLDPNRPVVIQLARLSAQKDPLAFVEGAALVLRQCPDVQFAMLGQGPLEQKVVSRIQTLGLQKHIHLLGWRDRAHRLLPAADVVTLTSRWEGSPYSLLEAMAASRPVVATAVNGCPELIADGDTGFLVPPGDTSAWARSVLTLLEQPDLAEEMGKRARQRVEQQFSVQATTERTIELYQRLVQTSRPRRA